MIKSVFFFNNTALHISRLTANFVFQAFERRKKHNNNNQLHHSIMSSIISLNLSVHYCILIGNTMYRNGNTK